MDIVERFRIQYLKIGRRFLKHRNMFKNKTCFMHLLASTVPGKYPTFCMIGLMEWMLTLIQLKKEALKLLTEPPVQLLNVIDFMGKPPCLPGYHHLNTRICRGMA